MKGRGDGCGLRSRIAAAGNAGWTPRSSQAGYAPRTAPAKPPRPPIQLDRGEGYRKKDGITSWRAPT